MAPSARSWSALWWCATPVGGATMRRFFCTDLGRDAAFVLQTYAHRWTLEVTFHDSKQHLGFGQAQNQTPRAVARTAPFAGVVYSLVLLWAAAHLQQGGTLSWIVRPW